MLRIGVVIILVTLLVIVLTLLIRKNSDWLSKPIHLWGVILLILAGFGFFLVLALYESGERVPYVPYEKRQIVESE